MAKKKKKKGGGTPMSLKEGTYAKKGTRKVTMITT